MPMPSRSVRPAGKRHSHGEYVDGADAAGTLVTYQRCARDSSQVLPVAVPTAVGARSGKPAGTSVCTRFRTGLGNSAGPQQRAPDIDVPSKRGRGRLQPGRMPGDDGIAGTGTVAPARGLRAPATARVRASGATARHAVIFICHRDAMQLAPSARRLSSAQGTRARVAHAFCQCWSVACRLRRYERGDPHRAAAEAAAAVRQHVRVP